jgi:hypothetical protein
MINDIVQIIEIILFGEPSPVSSSSFLDESRELLLQLDGCLRFQRVEVVRVVDALLFEQLHLAGVTAGLELPVVPQRALLEQDVVPGHAHQHALARDPGGGRTHRVVHERVHAWVVQPGGLRDHEPPRAVHEPLDLGSERDLAADGLRPGEVRMHEPEAAEGHAVGERTGGGGADGHVVGDVGAGAAPDDEHARKVGVVE